MMENKHKVFISYHHANDQFYKDVLIGLNEKYNLFIDTSVHTHDINENLDDHKIREIIRDEYLRDSSVTIVLVGQETRSRKHVDWEIYSSMHDGTVNKKSGILVINLPCTNCNSYVAAHGNDEKLRVYPRYKNWETIRNRDRYETIYPYLPDRIIDNLLKDEVKISVTHWDIIAEDCEKLRYLINATYNHRGSCNYDLSRHMKRANA